LDRQNKKIKSPTKGMKANKGKYGHANGAGVTDLRVTPFTLA